MAYTLLFEHPVHVAYVVYLDEDHTFDGPSHRLRYRCSLEKPTRALSLDFLWQDLTGKSSLKFKGERQTSARALDIVFDGVRERGSSFNRGGTGWAIGRGTTASSKELIVNSAVAGGISHTLPLDREVWLLHYAEDAVPENEPQAVPVRNAYAVQLLISEKPIRKDKFAGEFLPFVTPAHLPLPGEHISF